MKKPTSIVIQLAAGAFFFTWSLQPAHSAISKRTLTRTEDFIVLTGRDVKTLAGAETADLRLYSCGKDVCSPVPVQIDKVDSTGRYVFPQDTNPGRDGAVLDDNDEISFMASDAGDRIPANWRPDGAARGVQIELRDPLDNGTAWLYLFDQPGAPVPDLADYVDYVFDGENVLLKSSQFVMGSKKERYGYDIIRMLNQSGEFGPDLLDRQRVGIEAKMAGEVSLSLSVPEGIIKPSHVGVIDGPVRVIVDEVVLVHVGDLSLKWGAENFNKYYRCGQNNSVNFSFPLGVDELFKSILFYWGLDFTPDIIGSYYLDPNQTAPLPIGNQARKETPDDASHFWWGLYGKQGAVLQALKFDDYMVPYFTCDGRWRQNPEARIKKGDYPGRLEIGFGCHEIGSCPSARTTTGSTTSCFPKTRRRRGSKRSGTSSSTRWKSRSRTCPEFRKQTYAGRIIP